MPKPICVLLDANIIIELYEHTVWELLQHHVTIVIPSVVRAEAKHTPNYLPIDLGSDLHAHHITERAASASDIAQLSSQFDRLFLERIDAGEAEALALLYTRQLPDHLFCTGDGPAIKALAMLDMSDSGISLEDLLNRVGLGRRVRRQFSEKFYRERLAEGVQNRITGVGLRKKKPEKA